MANLIRQSLSWPLIWSAEAIGVGTLSVPSDPSFSRPCVLAVFWGMPCCWPTLPCSTLAPCLRFVPGSSFSALSQIHGWRTELRRMICADTVFPPAWGSVVGRRRGCSPTGESSRAEQHAPSLGGGGPASSRPHPGALATPPARVGCRFWHLGRPHPRSGPIVAERSDSGGACSGERLQIT